MYMYRMMVTSFTETSGDYVKCDIYALLQIIRHADETHFCYFFQPVLSETSSNRQATSDRTRRCDCFQYLQRLWPLR